MSDWRNGGPLCGHIKGFQSINRVGFLNISVTKDLFSVWDFEKFFGSSIERSNSRKDGLDTPVEISYY